MFKLPLVAKTIVDQPPSSDDIGSIQDLAGSGLTVTAVALLVSVAALVSTVLCIKFMVADNLTTNQEWIALASGVAAVLLTRLASDLFTAAHKHNWVAKPTHRDTEYMRSVMSGSQRVSLNTALYINSAMSTRDHLTHGEVRIIRNEQEKHNHD
jgi:hypothetical protein